MAIEQLTEKEVNTLSLNCPMLTKFQKNMGKKFGDYINDIIDSVNAGSATAMTEEEKKQVAKLDGLCPLKGFKLGTALIKINGKLSGTSSEDIEISDEQIAAINATCSNFAKIKFGTKIKEIIDGIGGGGDYEVIWTPALPSEFTGDLDQTYSYTVKYQGVEISAEATAEVVYGSGISIDVTPLGVHIVVDTATMEGDGCGEGLLSITLGDPAEGVEYYSSSPYVYPSATSITVFNWSDNPIELGDTPVDTQFTYAPKSITSLDSIGIEVSPSPELLEWNLVSMSNGTGILRIAKTPESASESSCDLQAYMSFLGQDAWTTVEFV